MSRLKLLIAAAAAATALAGCGRPAQNEAAANRTAVAESRTENGQLTVRAQGVDLKIDLPPPLRRMAGDDRALVYPGTVGEVRAEGGVIAFRSDDAPETVARWYRDPARASRFSVATDARQGSAIVIAGAARNGGGLTIRLAPAAGGGTDGRIIVADRD
jgi:hypothetical protein